MYPLTSKVPLMKKDEQVFNTLTKKRKKLYQNPPIVEFEKKETVDNSYVSLILTNPHIKPPPLNILKDLVPLLPICSLKEVKCIGAVML
jgi:hypothetical protein